MRRVKQKLLSALIRAKSRDYLALFLQSKRAQGVSLGTFSFYNVKIGRFLMEANADKAKRQDIENFLLQFENPGNRHAYYRAIKTFYNWLQQTFGIQSPMRHIRAPKLTKLILPSHTAQQVLSLIDNVHHTRDKAIIALFTESGLRLSELSNIRLEDINWQNRTIKTLGKGKVEAFAPFGELSDEYLRAWLRKYTPNGNVWGLSRWGIVSMLRRLEAATGVICNPHTFRRTFACLLRKAGVDTMTIKDLGRWESLEMVQRYTRSVRFHDSLKFYKSPLS